MAEQRKQYTREFKREAVRLFNESGRSKAQIARELGIHDSLLKRWKTQMEERPHAEAFPAPVIFLQPRRRSGACGARTSSYGGSETS